MPRLLIVVVLLCSLALFAQEQMPAEKPNQQSPNRAAAAPLSPPGQATFKFADGKQITVDYSRPSIRGRKIMGGLVPYDRVWRTGANAATTLTTQGDLTFGSVKVPAGKYTIYTIPGEKSWTVIINRQTGQWGTQYDQSQDLGRVNVTPATLPQPVEQFTISFENRGADAGVMKLDWEKTSVPVEFKESK
jgi:hypothetical protein